MRKAVLLGGLAVIAGFGTGAQADSELYKMPPLPDDYDCIDMCLKNSGFRAKNSPAASGSVDEHQHN